MTETSTPYRWPVGRTKQQQDALNYARRIRNDAKQAYALDIIARVMAGASVNDACQDAPVHGLGFMGAQAVRMELGGLLRNPREQALLDQLYPLRHNFGMFYTEEAKADARARIAALEAQLAEVRA